MTATRCATAGCGHPESAHFAHTAEGQGCMWPMCTCLSFTDAGPQVPAEALDFGGIDPEAGPEYRDCPGCAGGGATPYSDPCPTCHGEGQVPEIDTPPQLTTRNTSELRTGDIVHLHGMRLRVGEITTGPEGPHGPVYWSPSMVLNLAALEATAKDDPASDAAYELRFIRERRGTWNVQGNRLARWTVETHPEAPPRRITSEPPGWEGTRALHDRLYGPPAEAPPTPRRLAHLVSGDGRSVVCGITRAQADAEYAPDAPPCPTCGPRGGRVSATRARLTPHQRQTFDRLERLAQRSGDGWVSADTLGSRGALEHLERKGYAERRTELGPRGGEHRSYRPVTS